MAGQKAKAVDVSIFKTYNWDCPRCNAFNKKIIHFNIDIDILVCQYCGAQVEYSTDPVDDWVFEEEL